MLLRLRRKKLLEPRGPPRRFEPRVLKLGGDHRFEGFFLPLILGSHPFCDLGGTPDAIWRRANI